MRKDDIGKPAERAGVIMDREIAVELQRAPPEGRGEAPHSVILISLCVSLLCALCDSVVRFSSPGRNRSV